MAAWATCGRASRRAGACSRAEKAKVRVACVAAALLAGLAPTFLQDPDGELEPQPGARPEVARELFAARGQPRHASDGGGRAWIEAGGAVRAKERGRWRIEYEAGPLGIADGGAVFLQVSPFWGWSTPQVEDEGEAGFTRVTTAADGVALEPLTLDRQLLGITIRGRALRPGERLSIDYGAGPQGARADDHAEACSRFWIAVDGDGDGVRKVLVDSPCVRVLPGPPARLVVHVPSVARPGETLRATLAVLDSGANLVSEVSGRLELAWEGVEAPPSTASELTAGDGGRKQLSLVAPPPGLHHLKASLAIGERRLEAESNPLEVSDHAPRILWADLHGHSADSDGTGTPDDYFTYARDVAGLDVAALTDHDHWGLLLADEHPALWAENVAAARRADRPGRFLALPGFEWTSWIWGHRHVVFFGDPTPLLSSIDPAHDTPWELWRALREVPCVTVPHHPAGGPVPVDWRVRPDAELEVALEIASAHGSSEALDAPKAIYSAVAGCAVRDALERGWRYGFVASGDGHDGHPGLTHLGPHYPIGGLAAILSQDLTREGVLAALRARRTYATTGPRMILRVALGEARMGEITRAAKAADLYLRFVGTAAVREAVVVRSGKSYIPVAGEAGPELELSATLEDLEAGEWIYVRVEQQDGHMAWSSPVFVE